MPNFSSKNALLLLFLASAIVIIAQACLGKKYNIPEYHSFLSSSEFIEANRSVQLQKCASCHKEIVENELAGPHAAAYNMLLEHREFVNSPAYQCSFYTTRVNRDFEDCVGCHAPENLLQTILFDSAGKAENIIRKVFEKPVPPKRSGEPMRLSGIDCLSCHYDGNTLVSLKHDKTADDSLVGKQSLNTIINNNLSCFPCHMQIVKSFNAQMSIEKTGSAMCLNCHQEYKEGKGTHYYYWQHGNHDRKAPMLTDLVNDFHFEMTNGKTGFITWKNTVIPHGISSGPEVIVECEVLDKDSNVLGKQTIRTNNKKHFDQEMYATMGNNYLFGTLGDTIPLNGKPLKYPIEIKNAHKIEYLKVSLYHKAQYWFPDSLRVLTEQKIAVWKNQAPNL